MQRETLGFYILRLLIALSILLVLGMVYWSTLLLEENVNKIRVELSDLKTDINLLRQDLLRAPRRESAADTKATRPHIDPSLPNMMTVDKFYTDALPKMLPANFKPQGTLRTAEVGRPANLHPFNNLVPAPILNDLVSGAVANLEFGKFETLSEGMAIKMEERVNPKSGAPEYWVHLREGLYWQPLRQEFFGDSFQIAPFFKERHPVTSEDFKLYIDAILNPHNQLTGALAARTVYDSIEEIEVVDPLTFIVRWKTHEVEGPDGHKENKIIYLSRFLTGGLRPLASFVYKYFPNGKKIIADDSAPDTYRTNSVWAQNFTEHWSKQILICCGPWFFDSISDTQIKLVRNPDFYNPLAVLSEAMVVYFKDSPDAALQAFKANQIDVYNVPSNKIAEMRDFMKSNKYKEQAAKGAGIEELHYIARLYFFIAWNEANELFKSTKVREALTMAIDRKRIVDQIYNGMAIQTNGTFYIYSKERDPNIQPWPYDPQQAKQYLEEEGWFDSDGDGILDKVINGKKTPFQFTLNYFVKDPLRKAVCEFIATSLKEIGIQCFINGVDTADYTALFDDKSFEGLMMGWVFGTPPDNPKQLWYSAFAKQKGSSNIIGFENAEVDHIIEQLEYEYNSQKRTELYRRFDNIIHMEAPYTFLLTPKEILLYRSYVKNVFIPAERQDLIPNADVGEPFSSMYYISTE